MRHAIRLFAALPALALACSTQAAISLSIDAESIRRADGSLLSGSGLAALVVSAEDDAFSLPVEGAIIPDGSDDQIVAMWDLGVGDMPDDAYLLLAKGVEFQDGWDAGDPLGLYWFPELTSADPAPGPDSAYGFFRDVSQIQGGDAWSLPEDGALLHSLKFFTADADKLVAGGPAPGRLGRSALAVGQEVEPASAPNTVEAGEPDPGAATIVWEGGSALGGGFRIERRLVGETEWKVIGFADPDATSFTDDTILRGKEFEYRVFAINGFAADTSVASLPLKTQRSNLANISTRGVLGSGVNVMIAGFVIEGSSEKTVLSRTVGPELANRDVSNFSPDPVARLFKGAEELFENDDWGEGDVDAINTISDQVGAPRFQGGSKDSAFTTALPPGPYTIISADQEEPGNVALVEVFDSFTGDPIDAEARLVNISTRGFVGTGSSIVIGGFVVTGKIHATLLIRGVGPLLTTDMFNPEGNTTLRDAALLDPELVLFRTIPGQGSEQVAANDDWGDDNPDLIAQVSDQVGAPQFEDGSKDAALLVDLDPGIYTVFLRGVDSATGVALVEIFDVPDEG